MIVNPIVFIFMGVALFSVAGIFATPKDSKSSKLFKKIAGIALLSIFLVFILFFVAMVFGVGPAIQKMGTARHADGS